ncbi:peptide-methionine (S)-S-oxide reductase [Sunxiuqinia elliptica]|uniref:Peptide methionine sulfoxide reductase MsrA n=2 Tax=Sunxiuqinia elliptica TaxID=655355 RepID=A0A1I2J9V4_9BACT|nr:peptide-methionine (S)-S-oxide reductase [Sunxiuqinia elliptica]
MIKQTMHWLVFFMLISLSSGSTQKGKTMELATFGNGCFWCTEAVFKELNGVIEVTSGFSGGEIINPSYREVTTGRTGHAEVIEIEFDPAIISFQELLEVFWSTHDPTTLNRQGADVGTQYRSAVFYHNEHQRQLAEEFKQQLNEQNVFGKPVVTEISPWKNFFKAEDYHQDYYENNPNQGYCQFVIVPKLDKFRKIFKAKLK